MASSMISVISILPCTSIPWTSAAEKMVKINDQAIECWPASSSKKQIPFTDTQKIFATSLMRQVCVWYELRPLLLFLQRHTATAAASSLQLFVVTTKVFTGSVQAELQRQNKIFGTHTISKKYLRNTRYSFPALPSSLMTNVKA